MDIPSFPQGASIGRVYGPAVQVQTQEEADAYFEGIVRWTQASNAKLTRSGAEGIVRTNLGYYAGYYSEETRERVQRLYKAMHPIFDGCGP